MIAGSSGSTYEDGSYTYMFYGCSNLTSIECHATDISGTDCISLWLSGASPTGIFKKMSGVTYPEGPSGIPSGWTIVNM